MVVTMQNRAPLEGLERLRADFVGMVSHELRAPRGGPGPGRGRCRSFGSRRGGDDPGSDNGAYVNFAHVDEAMGLVVNQVLVANPVGRGLPRSRVTVVEPRRGGRAERPRRGGGRDRRRSAGCRRRTRAVRLASQAGPEARRGPGRGARGRGWRPRAAGRRARR